MAADSPHRDTHAIDVADSLMDRHGASALSVALERRFAAAGDGSAERAAFYQAVCTILTDRARAAPPRRRR